MLADVAAGTVVVHDRYTLYDNTAFAGIVHQLCTQHLLRDLAGAGETYPDAVWPGQITDARRRRRPVTPTPRRTSAAREQAGRRARPVRGSPAPEARAATPASTPADPAPLEDPAEDLRPAHQHHQNRRPVPGPGLPVHREQTRPRPVQHPARRVPRPHLDTRPSRRHLTAGTHQHFTNRPHHRPVATRCHPPTPQVIALKVYRAPARRGPVAVVFGTSPGHGLRP